VKVRTLFMALILTLSCSGVSGAQAASNMLEDGEWEAFLQVGMNAEIVLSFGVARGFSLLEGSNFLNRAQAHVSATVRMARPDLADISFGLGFKPTIVEVNGWSASLLLAPELKLTKNNLFRGVALGTNFGLVSGYFSYGASLPTQ